MSYIYDYERIVAKGDHVLIHYTVYCDGEMVETTDEEEAKRGGIFNKDKHYKPWWSIAGAGRFLRGIEEALIGMREGEEKIVEIPPEKGYKEGHKCHGKPLKVKIRLLSHLKPYHIAELHC